LIKELKISMNTLKDLYSKKRYRLLKVFFIFGILILMLISIIISTEGKWPKKTTIIKYESGLVSLVNKTSLTRE